MNIIEKHQKKYFQTLINAYISLNIRHGKQLDKEMVETFYYNNYTNVILRFTDKGKLLNYKFVEVD